MAEPLQLATPILERIARPRWSPFLLVSILLLVGGAVWLRLRLLGYTEVWQDQALTLNMALEWVHGGAWPLASLKSSFGVFNPPLIEYLYAIPLLASTNLLGEVWLVAVANLAGLLIAGLAAARVFGWRTAWWATLLFIVNPWAVYYGRLVWMQSYVPAFAAVFFACVLLYFARQPRAKYVIVGALSLSATIQVHLTAVVLLVVLALVLACFPAPRRWRPWLLGSALFVFTWIPFLLFEWRTGFADWTSLRAGLGQSAHVSDAALLILFDLMQSKGIFATLGRAAGLWQAQDLRWLPSDALVAVTFTVAAVGLALRTVRAVWKSGSLRRLTREQVGQAILLVWVFVPLLAFVRFNQYLQNYYFLYLLPAVFVLLASASDQAYRWLQKHTQNWASGTPWHGQAWVPALAFLPIGLIAFQQGRLDLAGQNLAARGAAGQERLVDVNKLIVTSRAALMTRPDCQLVVIGQADQYENSPFALLREFAKPNRVRFLSATSGFLVPPGCAVYLDTIQQPDMQSWLQATTLPLPQATIRTPEAAWRFFDLPSDKRALAMVPFTSGSTMAEWENGLQLHGVAVQGNLAAGQTVQIGSAWTVTRPVAPQAIHFGWYLLDESGSLVAQVDGAGVDSSEWSQGDDFATIFNLTVPAQLAPGRYSLATALYEYPAIVRLNLTHGGNLYTITQLPTTVP
jgi:hypothetical protein